MPYEDNTFQLVVFDPPHLRQTRVSEKTLGFQHIKYGSLAPNWRVMLADGFKEAFRVLKPGGFLVFKWNETDFKVSEILKLTDQKPIFGHKSGKNSKTHWLLFMKQPTTKQLAIF